jgi:hypothetical protein
MYQVKNTKSERNKKVDRKKDTYNHLTPEKYTSKRSTINTVSRLEKRYGYHFESVDDCELMRRTREEFREKAAKYVGGK